MISSLTGTVSDVAGGTIEITVQGVGYEVNVPVGVAGSVTVGDPIHLSIQTIVREDAFILFGFEDSEQRRSFRDLITVTGVGPKLALSVLSSFTVDGLRKAVAGGDVDGLTAVPGVGKRSAQRMVLELKEKMGMPDGIEAATGVIAEARDALANLGYSSVEVREVLEKVPASDSEAVESVVKAALKELARS